MVAPVEGWHAESVVRRGKQTARHKGHNGLPGHAGRSRTPYLNTIMKPAMKAKAWNGYGCRKYLRCPSASVSAFFAPKFVNSSRQAAITAAATENGSARGIADPYKYVNVRRPQYTFGYLIMVPGWRTHRYSNPRPNRAELDPPCKPNYRLTA